MRSRPQGEVDTEHLRARHERVYTKFAGGKIICDRGAASRGIRARPEERARKVVITDLKNGECNVISTGAPFIFHYSAGKSERSPSMEIDVRGGRLNAGSLESSRRVNTARQSKGLPSSHYLIIGVILNRSKSHLQTGIVTSRRVGVLSNDLLEERRSFVRTTVGGQGYDARARRTIRSFVNTRFARGEGGEEREGGWNEGTSYVFLISRPNYP